MSRVKVATISSKFKKNGLAKNLLRMTFGWLFYEQRNSRNNSLHDNLSVDTETLEDVE